MKTIYITALIGANADSGVVAARAAAVLRSAEFANRLESIACAIPEGAGRREIILTADINAHEPEAWEYAQLVANLLSEVNELRDVQWALAFTGWV